MNRLTQLLLALLFCVITAPAPAKELIREFKGSESRYTGEFEVRAPWILDWRVTGDLSLAPAVEVSLFQAGTSVYVGSVLITRRAGNGVRLFNESGTFQFQVNATLANWTLRVEELTRAEAEAYTPMGVE